MKGEEAMTTETATCPGCGEEFIRNVPARKYCCTPCAKRYQHALYRAAVARGEKPARMQLYRYGVGNGQGMEPHRTCHDCGKATRNYRCTKCLKAWRSKHGVPEDGSPNHWAA